MPWFDDLAKSLATANVPRKTVLANVARVVASAAVFPWTTTSAVAAALEAAEQPARGAASMPMTRIRPVRGTPALSPLTLPSSSRIGACTFRYAAGGNGLTYSASSNAGGRALLLTVDQQAVSEGVDGRPARYGGTTTIVVTADGAPVVRIESNFRPAAKNAQPSGTFSVRYGTAMRGPGDATFTVDRGTVSGAVGARAIVPFAARGMVAPEAVRFSDAAALPRLEVEQSLRDGVAALFARAKTELAACAGTASPARAPRSHRTLTRAAHHHEPAVLAQTSPDYPRTTNQNFIGSDGAGTPDCNTCLQNVVTSQAECLIAAAATAFFCPPCAAGALPGCYTTAAMGFLGCHVPTIGGCAEVICPSGGTCDKRYTCCGHLCCASGDVCTNGVCCPPDAPLGCGQPRVTCCEPGATCCGDLCCPAGSVCGADGTCFTCPSGSTTCGGNACCRAGQTCHNGKCCDFLCGDDCCLSGEVCNHQSQTCGVGSICGREFCGFAQTCINGRCLNVATPAPSSRPKGQYMQCRAGYSSCNSPNPDGTITTICCPSNMNCCNGVCCTAPNETCCSRGGALGCNVCIR